MAKEQKLLAEYPTAFDRTDDNRMAESVSFKIMQRRDKTFSSDKSKLRVYNSSIRDDWQPLAEIRHAVQSWTIVYTAFLILMIIIIGAGLFISIEQHHPLVKRYMYIPFFVWALIGVSSFIFRWQSRKLMMTGYLKFYRKSSWIWKASYGVCSSAFAIGTTFFTVSQENRTPGDEQTHAWRINKSTVEIILNIFWSVTFVILLFLYLSLLTDYIKHNRKRMLPDGVNYSDYRALSDVTATSVEEGTQTNQANDDIAGARTSRANGEQATLIRQAVTIRYLEKQQKLLMEQLTQPNKKPAPRNHDGGLEAAHHRYLVWEFKQLSRDKKRLEEDCKNLRFQLGSNQQELDRQRHKFTSLQGIQQKLEKDLEEAGATIAAKQVEVNQLQMRLDYQQVEADHTQRLINSIKSSDQANS